jgi:hypothetical protein
MTDSVNRDEDAIKQDTILSLAQETHTPLPIVTRVYEAEFAREGRGTDYRLSRSLCGSSRSRHAARRWRLNADPRHECADRRTKSQSIVPPPFQSRCNTAAHTDAPSPGDESRHLVTAGPPSSSARNSIQSPHAQATAIAARWRLT